MTKAYYSSALDYSTNRVWGLVRDFNNYPEYIDSVTESKIEDGKRGDEIGAIRCFRINDSWERQRLTAHSDAAHSFSYAGMEPTVFPSSRESDRSPNANYTGTLQLTPIIDGNRTFIEWSVKLDCSREDAAKWKSLFMELIPEWINSLKRTLDDR